MPRRKKTNQQLSIPGIELNSKTNHISVEDFKKIRKPRQIEKKFMQNVMELAAYYNLPCIHIDYFCGNKFLPRCQCGSILVCPKCKKSGPNIVQTCRKIINSNLAGHFDILGIGWTIETKHKVNKGKQTPKLSQRQSNRKLAYELFDIPHMAANEDSIEDLNTFFKRISSKK